MGCLGNMTFTFNTWLDSVTETWHITYTVSHKKCTTLFSTITLGRFFSDFYNFCASRNGMNTLQSTYSTAWRHYNCITSYATKLWPWQCYLQFKTTMADCFLECIRLQQFFATFAESDPIFIFSNSCWKIIHQSSGRNLFQSHRFLIKSLHPELNIFNFNSKKWLCEANFPTCVVTQFWCHQAIKYVYCRIFVCFYGRISCKHCSENARVIVENRVACFYGSWCTTKTTKLSYTKAGLNALKFTQLGCILHDFRCYYIRIISN